MIENPMIDFAPLIRRETSIKIISSSNQLFEAVKSSPLQSRKKFPSVLKNNNFESILRLTTTHAFLEVMSKTKARSERDRGKAYRNIFASTRGTAMMKLQSRFSRVSDVTFIGPHAFELGTDTSLCVWDVIHKLNESDKGENINLLYAVGFGKEIKREDAWLEFDSLIRISFDDWRL